MLGLTSLKIFYALMTIIGTTFAATDKVVCYYSSQNADTFAPEDIDVSICTHINFAFMGINEDGTLRLDVSPDLLYRLGALKSKNPNLKLVFSVGGFNEGSVKFSNIAADAGKIATMASSSLTFLRNYNFDGIDVDWEFPGQNGGVPADGNNFVTLLQTLSNTLKANGNYIVTTAVTNDPDGGAYDVARISQSADFINLMTYDFHYASSGKTGENSPLYGSSTDSAWESTHSNCDSALNNWLNRGATVDKVNLGLAFYGHGFILADPNNNGVGAPAVSDFDGGTYDKICSLSGWTEVWNDQQKVPYKYSGNQWIGFDNPQSIGLKVQYAKSRGLAGVIVWAVNQDNKDGTCGRPHSLLQAVRDNL